MNQPSNTPSADSGQHSAAGPVPVLQALAEYMGLVPPHATTYSGEENTTPFRDWEMQTLSWMRSFRIPAEYRVDIAQTLLRGPALQHWHEREAQMGHENDWVIFSISMSAAFHEIDDMTEWTRRADRFYQRGGETIRAYSDRFIDEMVNTYPKHGIRGLLCMQVFSRGIHPYFQPPHPHPPFRTFESMRRAYIEYADQIYPPIPRPENRRPRFARNPHIPPQLATVNRDMPGPSAPAQPDQLAPAPNVEPPQVAAQHEDDSSEEEEDPSEHDTDMELDDDADPAPHQDD